MEKAQFSYSIGETMNINQNISQNKAKNTAQTLC
jgi:hypothetical protein